MKKILKWSIIVVLVIPTAIVFISSLFTDSENIEQIQTISTESIEDKIINTLSESDKKDLFLSILNAQDLAEKEAKILVPNDNNFDKRIDASRKLQDKYELELYKKQSWWTDINEDKSIAQKIKLKITSLGVSSNWLN
jgi:hypothetical protein